MLFEILRPGCIGRTSPPNSRKRTSWCQGVTKTMDKFTFGSCQLRVPIDEVPYRFYRLIDMY